MTAVITNNVSLFKNETISVNVSKTKTDVYIAIVLRCSRGNLLTYVRYLCNVFIYKKTLRK